MNLVAFLQPYELSIVVIAVCLAAALAYGRGAWRARRAGERVGWSRATAFFLGLGAMYVVLQTQFDYYAQHMFWLHRVQHLILHHLAPFLIVLSAPATLMARGLPARAVDGVLRPMWRHRVTQLLYRGIQQPVVASLLFVGLIYFWLVPSVHFDAMLSVDYYKAMNWSMAIDGLLFWWLILNPRGKDQGGLGFGVRLILLWAIMLPQIALGAYIALNGAMLYDIYDVCGRAWPISPMTDQEIGGLITWIPSSMMSVVAALVVLRYWLRDNRDGKVAGRVDGMPAKAVGS